VSKVFVAVSMLAALVGSVARAHVPEDLRGRPVVRVEVRGPARATTQAREVGIPVGARVSRRMLRDAVLRLVASERWADVQLELVAEGDGVRVVATLRPRIVLQRVDLVGNRVLDDNELLREMRVSSGSEIEREDLPEVAEAIERAYAARGYERAHPEMILRDTDDPAIKVLRVELDEGDPTRVVEVIFDGADLPRGATLSVDEGDALDARQIERAVRDFEQRLHELGYLEARLRSPALERTTEGVRVRIPTVLGPHYTQRIRGYRPLEIGDVRDAMNLGEERLRAAEILALEARVTDLYQRHGFHEASVEVTPVRGERDGEAILDVAVSPGVQLDVVARAYPGSRHFDQDFLDEQIDAFLEERVAATSLLDPVDNETIERTFFDPSERRRTSPRPVTVDPGRVFYEPAYEAAIEHVQELYEAAGFLGAEVGPFAVDRLDEGRAIVVVPVREGARTFLHGVELRGNEALGDREVLEASGLTRDMAFSYLALEQAERAIRDAYQAEGYYYVEVESEVRFSADRTRADVILRMTERFPVRVGEILVEGTERTRDGLVLRVADLQRGELLTPQGIREAQDRLSDLGIFSGVNIAPRDPELPARVKPITITVSERKPQFLDARFGVSTAQGARFLAEYGARNLGGTSLAMTLRASVAYQFLFFDSIVEERFTSLPLGRRLEWSVGASLDAPFIGLRNVRASLGVNLQHDNERNFSLDRFNVPDITFTWRPVRPLTTTFSAGGEINDIEIFEGESYQELLEMTTDLRLRNLIRVPQGRTGVVALSVSASLDRRDSPFVPTRGFFLTGTVEYANTVFAEEQMVGDEIRRFESNHFRLLLTGSAYVPLGKQLVFATQLQFGRVFHATRGSETYPNRQFFVGGVDTLRGYLQDALVPQDLAEEIAANPDLRTAAVVQGGDVFLVARGELRFPIVGSVQGGAFVDLGNAWIEPGIGNVQIRDLRPTAGLGIRLATPVGPLALDYGILLARREYLGEPFGSFHFSIGLF